VASKERGNAMKQDWIALCVGEAWKQFPRTRICAGIIVNAKNASTVSSSTIPGGHREGIHKNKIFLDSQ
jgi:hypothetical protein